MRRTFLSTLVVFVFMNWGFGQLNTSSEKISVKTYDENGLLERFHLKGDQALSFDIPKYIKENDHLERVVIHGSIRTALLTKTMKFDSDQQQNQSGDYICKEEKTNLTPFLGVFGTSGRKNLDGVDVLQIIPATSAAIAGMTANDDIIAIDGMVINSFMDLKDAVLSKEIGDRVELKLQNESEEYLKNVILGSRGMKTVTYKFCMEEQVEDLEERNLIVDTEDNSLTTFPNPTRSLSHVNFKSVSDEEVTFSVTDIKGSLIHKELFTNFNGNLTLDFNLGNELAGTYLFIIQQGKKIYTSKVQLMK